MARVMPFAHFLGLSGTSPRMEDGGEDDERRQRDGESDDEYARRMEEKDREEEEARRAEDERREEDARRAEEERREEESRRAEGEEDDVDAEEDDNDDKEKGSRAGRAKGARQRERIRCAAIVAAGVKAGRVNQACVFAFDSNLTASQAIAALNAAALDAPAARQGSGLRERMSAVRPPNVGADAAPSGPQNAAQLIIAADAKRRGQA
jgi:hypothetical protein